MPQGQVSAGARGGKGAWEQPPVALPAAKPAGPPPARPFPLRQARAARAARGAARPPLLNATTSTLLQLYSGDFVLHSAWVLVETAVRLLSPVALREFLKWMQRDAAAPRSVADWEGWMWAVAVAAGGVGMTIIHHVFFWWVAVVGFGGLLVVRRGWQGARGRQQGPAATQGHGRARRFELSGQSPRTPPPGSACAWAT
jgi:hypothetical protein